MLVEETNKFFKMHWYGNTPFPVWEFGWEWKGAVPNYLLPGLYALFSNDSLVYIGLGRGGKERGISARLEKHVLKKVNIDGDYKYAPQQRWADLGVNRIATIGFPYELSYLSPALEDYLIYKLKPEANAVGLGV